MTLFDRFRRIMREQIVTILLVGPPGLLRNALLAFVRATPKLEVIGLAHNSRLALEMTRTLQPAILLVDADLPDDGMLGLLRQMRSEQVSVKFITLSNNLPQQQACLHAGADQSLLKGFLGENLTNALLGDRMDWMPRRHLADPVRKPVT